MERTIDMPKPSQPKAPGSEQPPLQPGGPAPSNVSKGEPERVNPKRNDDSGPLPRKS